jgi:hypothetical protein
VVLSDRSMHQESCGAASATSSGPLASTHLRLGRISEFSPGSCFPNWLQGKPRMTRPNGASSSCSAFSSRGETVAW